MPHLAVLRSILQRFLDDAEEAKRDFVRHAIGDVISFEINLNICPRGEFPTEAPDCGTYAQILQLRRVDCTPVETAISCCQTSDSRHRNSAVEVGGSCFNFSMSVAANAIRWFTSS